MIGFQVVVHGVCRSFSEWVRRLSRFVLCFMGTTYTFEPMRS